MYRVVGVLIASLVVSAHATTLVEPPAPIELPTIDNKTPITLVAEEGFWTDYLNEHIVRDFTKATGVEVTVHTASLSDMYQLQTDSMLNGMGKYDVVTIEAGWAKEWAANGYTIPVKALIDEYDPQYSASLSQLTENYYPALLKILSYRGELHSLPYNSYVMGNHFRQDLFEHEGEQEDFLAKFGYPLQPPMSLMQLKDVAEFFTRDAGKALAGKRLEKPFYGVALMSGNRPHVNDELSSILWGMDGKWFVPEFRGQELIGFHLRTNTAAALHAAQYYRDLTAFAVPADESFAFLEAADALRNGDTAMAPFLYNNLWAITGEVNKAVKGGKLGITTVAGGRPYHGAYAFAVSYDSKNPEAAYWLLKYVSSFESQLAYAKAGGNPCRLDVVRYLIDSLPKGAAQRQALISSYQSDTNWQRDIHLYGHFTSTAMGTIYPMLVRAAYRIASGEDIEATLHSLSVQITTLQNLYGEEAMLAE
ncbi:ABC transporter substrate-binding protein [Thaumasiovibrio subtropicus]|uniref:ABC transporter substrate-binding protein n=1 Tax=Thaumasiovibrio subtropicus TaxID=1891207 RepID=UPI000B352716|nr:extracellular solute-binding protein [Thaumasiovibrio subtropicus]